MVFHQPIWKILYSQIGNLPPIFGVKIIHIWNHHLIFFNGSHGTLKIPINQPVFSWLIHVTRLITKPSNCRIKVPEANWIRKPSWEAEMCSKNGPERKGSMDKHWMNIINNPCWPCEIPKILGIFKGILAGPPPKLRLPPRNFWPYFQGLLTIGFP